jgi:hypothetical protein
LNDGESSEVCAFFGDIDIHNAAVRRLKIHSIHREYILRKCQARLLCTVTGTKASNGLDGCLKSSRRSRC